MKDTTAVGKALHAAQEACNQASLQAEQFEKIVWNFAFEMKVRRPFMKLLKREKMTHYFEMLEDLANKASDRRDDLTRELNKLERAIRDLQS